MRALRLFAGLMLLIFVGAAGAAAPAGAAEPEGFAAGGRLRPDGERWRIGYVEGEPFVNFAGNLYGILHGLRELGWIEDLSGLPYREGQDDSRAMWAWLAANDPSPYLEFVADAHWSFLLDRGEEEVVRRLREERDLDVVIAMGTYAGTVLARDDHRVPVLVLSSSDPVRAGIVASAEDPGRGHIWAFVDPTRGRRQIMVFHDLIGFTRLGMVHEDSELGRIFAMADEVEAVARERGFTIERIYVDEPRSEADRDRYHEDVLRAHQELAKRVDAMLIAVASIETARLPSLLEPFFEAGIPTFSQLGVEEVEQGAVLSVARSDFLDMGRFNAQVLSRVLHGESPRSISQLYTEAPRIAVNLAAAERIGYRVPFEVLLVADYVFHTLPGREAER